MNLVPARHNSVQVSVPVAGFVCAGLRASSPSVPALPPTAVRSWVDVCKAPAPRSRDPSPETPLPALVRRSFACSQQWLAVGVVPPRHPLKRAVAASSPSARSEDSSCSWSKLYWTTGPVPRQRSSSHRPLWSACLSVSAVLFVSLFLCLRGFPLQVSVATPELTCMLVPYTWCTCCNRLLCHICYHSKDHQCSGTDVNDGKLRGGMQVFPFSFTLLCSRNDRLSVGRRRKSRSGRGSLVYCSLRCP